MHSLFAADVMTRIMLTEQSYQEIGIFGEIGQIAKCMSKSLELSLAILSHMRTYIASKIIYWQFEPTSKLRG